MGFFQRLKKRVFTLNIEDNHGANQKPTALKKHPPPPKSGTFTLGRQAPNQTKRLEHSLRRKLKKQGQINKYVVGLSKSSFAFAAKLKEMQSRYEVINAALFEELEEMLIMADVSHNLASKIITEAKKEVNRNEISDAKLIAEIVASKMFICYASRSVVDTRLNIANDGVSVMLMVGVNGSGKTTSIAKVAKLLKADQKKVLIAAADTFRAGAINQLAIWAERVGVDIVKPRRHNSDPGAVVYEALARAKRERYDVLIIDTAGRLQNKVPLMQELAKISKIIKQSNARAPHEALLVIDATTGQNGVSQAKHFTNVTPLSGIVLTKMDGTSKGGIVLSIKDALNLPVKLIGLGEQLDDLQEFDLDAFIYGLSKGLMGAS